MPATSAPITLTLPWSEADSDSYADAIRVALAGTHMPPGDHLGRGRIVIGLRIYPAPYSACTIADCVGALYDAIEWCGLGPMRERIARIDCRFGYPSDRPRIQLSLRRA